jgi:hypothetical protein
LQLCKKKSPVDLQIFRAFIGFEFDEAARNQNQETREQFRSITNFLRNESDLREIATADMLALLVGFPYRPFSTFIQTPPEVLEAMINAKGTIIPEEREDKDSATGCGMPPAEPGGGGSEKNWKKYAVYGAIAAAVVLALLFMTNMRGQCMKWQADHYERVDCQAEGGVEGYNPKVFRMKKLTVTDTTTFFRNGKPTVWYIRQGGYTECFNMPGKHPVSGKALRPISSPMARELREAAKPK